jgi:hypothetical protein
VVALVVAVVIALALEEVFPDVGRGGSRAAGEPSFLAVSSVGNDAKASSRGIIELKPTKGDIVSNRNSARLEWLTLTKLRVFIKGCGQDII